MKSGSAQSSYGGFLIAFAAMLWATDSLFRYPLLKQGLSPVMIVLVDHIICLLVLFPFVYFRNRTTLWTLTPVEWLGVAFIGAGASGFATVLFTASFGLGNPSVSILIQKLQPIGVIGLAFLFLKERPDRGYWTWGSLALASGLVLSFPNFDFQFTREITMESKGSIYALIAAGIWAVGTVVGKALLQTLKPSIVTFWRFVFGAAFLLILAAITNLSVSDLKLLQTPENAQSLLYIAGVSGLLAMMLYYAGMKRTTATITTLMELLFPVSAVVLNALFLNVPLKPIQILASLVLLFSVTQLNSKSSVQV